MELKKYAGTKQYISATKDRTATFDALESGSPYIVVVITTSGHQKSDIFEKLLYTSK